MKRASILAVVLAFVAVGCGSSSTSPTPSNNNVTFTAQLLPSNEAPNPISGPESSSSGSATIVFVPTKDSSGNTTSVVGTATVNVQGFPSGSTITLAHIHTGAAGVAGGVLIGFVPSPLPTLTNGATSFSQTNSTVTPDQLTGIMNNPAGFYFNVHTALNPGGVMRGQLVRQQ
jgi:hypothetical protein